MSSRALALMATAEQVSDRSAVLAERAREGEAGAFGDLVEIYWPQLVALARAVMAGDEEAEDLVQDALLHAWKRIGSLRRPASVGAWLRRMVVRRCLTWTRRRRVMEPIEDRHRTAPISEPGARLDVERLLTQLSTRQRAALYLSSIEGLSDREAARILGMRPATVRVHRHRAMNRLREITEEKP